MGGNRESPQPYGSAQDLPSVVEMRQMLAGMKLVTRVVARGQRQGLVALEGKMEALVHLADRFYDVLGERHWIFTDHLPVTELEALLAPRPTTEAAEAGLIAIIAERLHRPNWEMGLLGQEPLDARKLQLERARQHYLDEQWDSCALVLVTVMDGFINDVEPAERRGLHAREPVEMVAWDSLTGHHKGLTAVMPVFLKSCKRRQDEEVFELHRHGIVHGTVVSYNNQVVATKAWNMLSAVVDWAAAKKKAAVPPEPKPTLRSTLALLVENAEDRRYRENFEASLMSANEPGFEELGCVQQARSFLESWQANQWGLVAESLPSVVLRDEFTPGRRAVLAKQIYEHTPLVDFVVTGVSFPQASAAVIHGTATIGDMPGPVEIRWIYQGADGNVARPGVEGARWVLAVYPPHTFIKEATEQAR